MKNTVIVEISGGCVTRVSGATDVRVVVIDYDNMRNSDECLDQFMEEFVPEEAVLRPLRHGADIREYLLYGIAMGVDKYSLLENVRKRRGEQVYRQALDMIA